MTTRSDVERWKAANPYILQNIQNSSALCGRYPTLEAATHAAIERGGVVAIEGNVVLFSEVPRL